MQYTNNSYKFSSDNNEEVTPVPISNTEVKLFSAENTWRLPSWKHRKSLDFIYSSLAQSVERSAVKQSQDEELAAL